MLKVTIEITEDDPRYQDVIGVIAGEPVAGPTAVECSSGGDDLPEYDSAGVPWDERIHTTTRSTKKDGTWTRRKGVNDSLYDRVMAEITGANTGGPGELPPPPPPPPPSSGVTFAEIKEKATGMVMSKAVSGADVTKILKDNGVERLADLETVIANGGHETAEKIMAELTALDSLAGL